MWLLMRMLVIRLPLMMVIMCGCVLSVCVVVVVCVVVGTWVDVHGVVLLGATV